MALDGSKSHDNFSIGIDGINNLITVEALAAGSGDQDYQYRAYFMAPDGTSFSFDFTVMIRSTTTCPCEPTSVSLTTPIVNQIYKVSAPTLVTDPFEYSITPS